MFTQAIYTVNPFSCDPSIEWKQNSGIGKVIVNMPSSYSGLIFPASFPVFCVLAYAVSLFWQIGHVK